MELNFKSLGSKYLFLMKLIFEPIALVRSARSAPPGPDRTEFAHLAPDRTDRTETRAGAACVAAAGTSILEF